MRKIGIRFLFLSIALTALPLAHSQESIIPRQTRLYYGIQVKEGINWLFSQIEYKDAFTLVGRRFHPSFSGFVELGNWYEHKKTFYGLGMEVQYSYRGGKITNKEKISHPPAEVMLDYLDLRLGYVGRTSGNGFFRVGLEFSFLQNATYKDDLIPQYNVASEAAKNVLGIWFEGGGRISKHLTMSFYLDWLFWGFDVSKNDLLEENFWEAPTDDHNLSMGVTLGWLFNPVKLGKNNR